MSLVRQRRIFLERLAPLQALPVAVLEPAVRTMCKSRSRFSCEPPQFCRFRQETRTRRTGPGFAVERLPLEVPFSLDAVKSGDVPHATLLPQLQMHRVRSSLRARNRHDGGLRLTTGGRCICKVAHFPKCCLVLPSFQRESPELNAFFKRDPRYE